MNTTRIPEGLTDPDDIDRWLDAQDDRELQAVAERDARDAAVMAGVPRYRLNPDAATRPNTIADIAACRAHAQLPFWTRWFTPAPSGWRGTATATIN